MRRGLNALYDLAATLAAVCMVALLGAVLLSIVSRLLGFNVSGLDSYAGYLMAATGFLALAHTLKKGEHIRVTLVIQGLGQRARHRFELWALALASLLALLLAFYSVRLAWQSWQFNDISTGNDATPLWLPQLGMAAGAVVFAIAFIDELALQWLGRRPDLVSGEMLRNE